MSEPVTKEQQPVILSEAQYDVPPGMDPEIVKALNAGPKLDKMKPMGFAEGGMVPEQPTSNDLLALLRFRVLDYRNATEEARERLMLEAADEIERLRRAADDSTAVHECICPKCGIRHGGGAVDDPGF